VVAGVLLVGLVAAAAVLGYLVVTQPSPTPVGANASERYAAIDGVEATVTTTIRRGNRTNRTVRHVEMRPNEGQVRIEAADRSVPGPERVVSNGSTKWSYDRDNGTVKRTDGTALRERMTSRGARIERLFNATDAGGAADTPTSSRDRGIAPLPAVPPGERATPQAPVSVADANGSYDVRYEGTAVVDGRQTHVLEITARGSGTTTYRNVTQRLWIDAEYYFPLRYRTSWVRDGESVEATVSYSNVSFDPGLSAERFAFEMPDDAALVGPDLGTDAADRLDSLDSISATVTSRTTGYEFNGTGTDGGYRSVQRVERRLDTGEQRIRVVDTTANGTALGTDLFVSNGTVTWLYDRDANNVTILRTGTVGNTNLRGERIERLFARLDRTRTTPDSESAGIPAPGISPTAGLETPGQAPSSFPRSGTDRYGVSFGGVEPVDGRPAYVLNVAPVTEDGNVSTTLANYSRTMWLDTQYFFPLKQRTQFALDGDEITSVTTYSNVTFDPELADGTFEFDPPANATISENDLSLGTTHDSPSAVETNATFPVPEPSVPRDFEFARGRTGSFNGTETASLVYTNETTRLTVSVYDFDQSLGGNGSFNTTGEPVSLGDRNGTYSRAGPSRSVSWSCAGREYSVSASGLSKSFLVEVASSIECE